MDKAQFNHWRELLKSLFPPSTYIRIRVDKSVVFGIDWRLQSTQAKPSQFSRLIKIMVTESVLADYFKLNPVKRGKADQKFFEFVRQQLQHFDPHHNTPLGDVPPQEEWVIEAGFFSLK